ncbi:hypothetical protein PanWU01x14_361320, partial [Parasponia andersonii]
PFDLDHIARSLTLFFSFLFLLLSLSFSPLDAQWWYSVASDRGPASHHRLPPTTQKELAPC